MAFPTNIPSSIPHSPMGMEWESTPSESLSTIQGKTLKAPAKKLIKETTKVGAQALSSAMPSAPMDSRIVKSTVASMDLESLSSGSHGTSTRLPEGPWRNTDLIIYPNNFHPLPVNGISESDFEKVNQFYLDIWNGKTIFQIKGDDDFKRKIFENGIIIILSRSLGREAMFKIANAKKPIQIIPDKTSNASVQFNKSSWDMALNTDLIAQAIGQLPDGRCIRIDHPFYVIMFHELCHCCHQLYSALSRPGDNRATIGDEYSIFAEQLAITGYGESTLLPRNRFNENDFRESFGLMKRVGHSGLLHNKESIEKDEKESFELGKKPIKWAYFEELAVCGLVHEMEEFLDEHRGYVNTINPIDKFTLLETAFVFAIRFDQVECFELLLHRGARPFHDHPKWGTPTDPAKMEKDLFWNLAYFVSSCGAPKILRQLLGFGTVQLNINKSLKVSLLYRLVSENCKKHRINSNIIGVIELLLKLKADPSFADEANINSLHIAAHRGVVEVIKVFLKAGLKIDEFTKGEATPLYFALRSKRDEAVRFLMANGAKVNAVSPKGNPITHVILRNEKSDTISKLFQISEINFKALDQSKGTLLHSLMKNIKIDNKNKLIFAKFLLEHGVDGEALDSDGRKFHHLCSDKFFVNQVMGEFLSYKPLISSPMSLESILGSGSGLDDYSL